MCFNDNGGWSCTGDVSPNFENITSPMGSCISQVVFFSSGEEISSTIKNSPESTENSGNNNGQVDCSNSINYNSCNGNNNDKNKGIDIGCFPNEVTLTLENGETRLMKDVKLGDSVKHGNDKYSKIFANGHKQYGDFNNYLKIKTSYHKDNNISPLLLSSNHYLYVNDSLQLARNVKLGDYLVNEKDELTPIISIESVYLQGINNPLTIDGSIVVNGIKTSCYTEALHPTTAKKLIFPLKMIYKLSGGKLMGIEDYFVNSIIAFSDYYDKLVLSNLKENKEKVTRVELETKIEIPPKD